MITNRGIKRLILGISALMLLTIFLAIRPEKKLKEEIKQTWLPEKANTIRVIHDENKKADDLYVEKDNRRYFRKLDNHTYFEIPAAEIHKDRRYFATIDIDGDSDSELLFHQKKNDTSWIYIYTKNHSNPIDSFKTVGGKNPGWDGEIVGIKLIDVNNDGCDDLLFPVNTAFHKQPRGLWVFDINNYKPLWNYSIGPSPIDVHIIDIDSDGKNEVILGSDAVANGSTENGFADTKSYIIVLDNGGNLKWSKPIGGSGTLTKCWVGNINEDREIEIVIAKCHGRGGETDTFKLLILGAIDGELKGRFDKGESYRGFVVKDIDRDGKFEIIVGNNDGLLRILDCEMDEPKEHRAFNKQIEVIGAVDLDGDGTMEILAELSDLRFLILDKKLRTLWRYPKDEKISVSIVEDSTKNKLLIKSTEGYGLYEFSGAGLDIRLLIFYCCVAISVTLLILIIVLVSKVEIDYIKIMLHLLLAMFTISAAVLVYYFGDNTKPITLILQFAALESLILLLWRRFARYFWK